MASPKRLDFSSPGAGGHSDNASPPSPSSFTRRKSERKPPLKLPAFNPVDEETKKKKKKKKKTTKKKLVSPTSRRFRIWHDEDELTILKGLVDFRNKTRSQLKFDWDAFYHFIGGSIVAKVSKVQVLSKIRELKRRFLGHLEKINEGKDPLFTRSTDSQVFGFSMMIWGPNEAETANGDMDKAQQIENGEETLKEDEEMANDNGDMDKSQEKENGDETFKENDEVNDNGATPVDVNGYLPREVVVDKITENGTTAGKESLGDDDDDDAVDELCAVQDAFETMMSEGLSEYQKKLHLEKLKNLGTRKRKELSSEWKALRVEEVKLNIKKLRLSAKLAEAANDR